MAPAASQPPAAPTTPTPSPTVENTPPERTHWTVAPDDGDFTSIQAAIQQVPPGSTLWIRPGIYRESFTVSHNLHLIGDGDSADIVIEATGRTLLHFAADEGTLRNMTLRLGEAEGISTCVSIARGSLLLEDCDISANADNVITVYNSASPIIRGNSIHGAKESGIYVYDNGAGLIVNNDIYANGLSGITVKTGGQPTVQDNRIHDNKQSGIYVYNNGAGLIVNNDIYANGLEGIAVETGGQPTVQGNRIHRNNQEAITVTNRGRGVYQQNDLRGNRRGAWRIAWNSIVRRENNLR